MTVHGTFTGGRDMTLSDGSGAIGTASALPAAGDAPCVIGASAPVTMDGFLRSVERPAWRFAEIALRDPDTALDAVQDAMLRLVKHYGHKPAPEWPRLFWSILRRRVIDLQRRRAFRQRLFVWMGRPGPDDADRPPAWDIPDPVHDPARTVASRQAYAALATAVHGLPHRQQEAFLLRILQGLDVADTAAVMHCSAGSVKTHLARAIATLREQLEDWR